MAKTPNSGFVSYLGSYGLGSNLQYDEHVAKTAQQFGIEAFEFDLPQQQKYRADIKRAIDQRQSCLILLSGRAGDGKTHFLRTLFTDPEYLGGTREEWNRSPNCFEFTKQGESGPIAFTLVKDFTSNDSDAEQKKLRATIEAIFSQNQNPQPDAPCRIVIIAGNNGKILERFQSFYGDQNEVNIFIHALERYMLEHDRSKIDELPGVQCHDMSACLGTKEIAAIYQKVLGDSRWEQCSECPYHERCPIVRNRQVLQEPLVLTRLLQIHELLVDNGLHFTMRNVLLLIVNALFGRTNDDKYLNCNVVMRNFKSLNKQIEALPLLAPDATDSERAARAFEIDHLVMGTPLGSKPFDNLLGLNLKAAASKRGRKKVEEPQSFLSDDTMPIFHELGTLSLGAFSTKLIDEFLVLGANTDVFSPEIAHYHARLAQLHDHYDLFGSLERCYRSVQSKDLDEDGGSSTEYGQMAELLMSLRRLLFFVLPDAQSDAIFQANPSSNSGKPFFAPFLLTAYPFALDYLKLKHDAIKVKHSYWREGQGLNLRATSSFDLARQLMVGLNRAFTNLMITSGAADEVYITTNNKIDPMALSVIYDRDRYHVPVDYQGTARDNALRFELLGEDRLALVFNAPELMGNEDSKLEAKRCYLELTPKLFEYLMSLAVGTSGLSFSQENTNDLAAFKASIDATITEQISFTYKTFNHEPSFDVLFNNIQICQLNEAGGLE